VIKTIPPKRNVKRQNDWLEKALQKSVTIIEVKGKGEKEAKLRHWRLIFMCFLT